MSILTVPWSDNDIELLKIYQSNSQYHKYTCGSPIHEGMKAPDLVPTRGGWICSEILCEYIQQWALKESLTIENSPI